MDLSIVIPCFNEEQNIDPLLENIIKHITPLDRTYEIIIIDDCSKDRTKEKICSAMKQLPTLKGHFLPTRCGQTAAISAGIKEASGEFIILMDGDLQLCASDIAAFLDKAEEGYDMVCGWRTKRNDSFIFKTLPSLMANTLIRYIFNHSLHDIGCPLKCCRKEVLTSLKLTRNDHRYIPLLVSRNIKLTEIKVKHFKRRYGSSKYNLTKTLSVIYELIVIFRLRRTKCSR